MQGHWLSQTRKLNRHYQSGKMSKSYPTAYIFNSHQATSSITHDWFDHQYADPNRQFPTVQSGQYLAIPQNKKVKILMYSECVDMTNTNDFYVGLEDPYIGSNSYMATVYFFDANDNNVTDPNNIARFYLNNTINNFSTMSLYPSGSSINNRVSLNVISRDKNNPTTMELDITNYIPQNAVKYRIHYGSRVGSLYIGYNTLPQTGVTYPDSKIKLYYRTEPQQYYV